MFSSNNENIGFSAAGQEELETVNGGVKIEAASAIVTGVAVGLTAFAAAAFVIAVVEFAKRK